MLYGRFLLVIISSISVVVVIVYLKIALPSPWPKSPAQSSTGRAEMPSGLCLLRLTQFFKLWTPWPGALSSLFAAACPVLCSGNGQYSKGTCQCYSGWKGAECDVPLNQCIDPSCGGHGSCIDGNCVCSAGYKGEHCEEGKPKGWAGVCRSGPMLMSLVLAPCFAKERNILHFKPLSFNGLLKL